jgi:hypothetical protein
MNYKVVKRVDRDDFELEVLEYLRLGYKLAGGVSVVQEPEHRKFIYYQALIKE